ncbi:MAG: hypothetical protein HY318_06055, partial [Armatimonadetes bacterium]|nr:hypothetical protein [Armatimonadota bacterium]
MRLDGAWQFRLDPEDRGLADRWFETPGALGDRIEVPGCWQGQGFGHEGKDTVWDFRLEARTFRATYTGTGWYGKSFLIPQEWQERRVWLSFGGAHPSAEVWLNGHRLGANNLPFVPFGFEVTEGLRREEENWLVVRVHEENRLLGLAFNWQGNWSGLYRGVELVATGPSFVRQVSFVPEAETGSLRCRFSCGGVQASRSAKLRISVRALPDLSPAAEEEVAVTEATVEHVISVPSPRLWSPDTPNLYRVDVVLESQGAVMDALSERIGFVTLSTRGKHFLINEEPYYLRGTGEFLSNPETGCPDTNRDRWRKKLRALRDYGYNYVRCQSFVPAPEYLDVADEVGLLIQSEMGSLGAWGGNTQWHVYAWPQPSPEYHAALLRQWNLVVERDVDHPSANLYCMSNELGAQTDFPRTAWQCYHETKARKPTAMVIWTDGGYNADLPGDFVNDDASKDASCDKPVVQHEFQWWSSFPDVCSRDKYQGAVRPYAAEMAQEAAELHGLAHVLSQAVPNSQRLQFVEAKGKMEGCRRQNATLAGICHFNAMDANPSPQGIIDEFYDLKYADDETWRQTNGDTVVLASLGFNQRVCTEGDDLECDLYTSDFSHPPMKHPLVQWEITAGGESCRSGEIPYSHKPYRTCPAGTLHARTPAVASPVPAALRVRVGEGDRWFDNQWCLWLFPRDVAMPADVVVDGEPRHTWLAEWQDLSRLPSGDLPPGPARGRVVLTERLSDEMVPFMENGGRVILAASEGLVRPFRPKFGFTLGHYFFTPPANYPPYEDGHDGTLITQHPMLGDFPHEG